MGKFELLNTNEKVKPEIVYSDEFDMEISNLKELAKYYFINRELITNAIQLGYDENEITALIVTLLDKITQYKYSFDMKNEKLTTLSQKYLLELAEYLINEFGYDFAYELVKTIEDRYLVLDKKESPEDCVAKVKNRVLEISRKK